VGVDRALSDICLKIENRDEIKFLEIGMDDDHVYFLDQFEPGYSATKLGKRADEAMIANYVKNQGKGYYFKFDKAD
jgi:hypothetical protein